MKEFVSSGTAVALAIVGLAAFAVIFSRNAQTASVINAGGNSFVRVIRCALGPIIGGGSCGNTAGFSSSPISIPLPTGVADSSIIFGDIVQ